MDEMLTQDEIISLMDELQEDYSDSQKIDDDIEKFPPHTDQWGYKAMFTHYRGKPKLLYYMPEYPTERECDTCGREFCVGDLYVGDRACPFCGQRYDIEFFIT